MGTSIRVRVGYTLLLFSLCFLPSNCQSTMTLQGEHKCKKLPDDQLEMELRVYDTELKAARLSAITDVKATIDTCNVFGLGSLTAPFYVKTVLSAITNNEIYNLCGVRVSSLGGTNYQYDWKFKSYTYTTGDVQFEQGVVMNVRCRTSDFTDGLVSGLVLPSTYTLRFSALNSAGITGLDQFAKDAVLQIDAFVYADEDFTDPQLAGAAGFYLTNCYSATNSAMTQHREQFINSVGCGIAGADYKPSSEFVQITGTNPLKLRAQFTSAKVIQNKKTIYFQCSVGRCDTACSQRCGGPGGTDTTVVYSTSFTIQDLYAQTMVVTPTAAGPPIVLTTSQTGDVIYLYTQHVKDGIGATTDMLDAQGFYVYNCHYSTNSKFKTSTQFVDNFGCAVSGTDFTPASDFIQDISYFGNSFIVKSGPFIAKKQDKYRCYIKCDTGKCTTPDHPYCLKRCGANGGVLGTHHDLGYKGMTTSITITDPTVTSILLSVQDNDGQYVTSPGITAYTDEPLDLSVTIDPNANDAPGVFSNAYGAFVYSCYAAELEEGEDIADVPANRRSYFIDDKGCVDSDSPYAPDAECKLTSMPGVPPYEITCGKIKVRRVANVGVRCVSGYCSTSDNLVCEDRCAQGALTANSFAHESNIPLTTQFLVQERDLRRTAIRSNEIRTLITVMCTVLPILLVILILVGTAVLVWRQRRRVKQDRDNRSYDYEH